MSRFGVVLVVLAFTGCGVDGPGRDANLRVTVVTMLDSTTGKVDRIAKWSDRVSGYPALIEFRVRTVADLRAVIALDLSSPDHHGYAPASFPDGLADLPHRQKKELFLASIRPIATFYNKVERNRRRKFRQAPQNRSLIEPMSSSYGVTEYPKKLRSYQDTLNVLSFRIGALPAGLILGQAALESGWGTSRLAAEQNNLFGMKRSAGGYSEFETLGHGVEAYVRNLNTHGAYANLRSRRRALLRSGKTPTVSDLIPALQAYSTRGTAYIKDLRQIINQNALDR